MAHVQSSTLITKVLGATLVLTYCAGALVPSSVESLALVPDKVVPRVWTLASAGFYEWNAWSLLLNLTVLFTVGQRLERVWGARVSPRGARRRTERARVLMLLTGGAIGVPPLSGAGQRGGGHRRVR